MASWHAAPHGSPLCGLENGGGRRRPREVEPPPAPKRARLTSRLGQLPSAEVDRLKAMLLEGIFVDEARGDGDASSSDDEAPCRRGSPEAAPRLPPIVVTPSSSPRHRHLVVKPKAPPRLGDLSLRDNISSLLPRPRRRSRQPAAASPSDG